MTVPTFRFTTPRCVLRPVAEADADALHALWTSAGVRRYLWDDEIVAVERVAAAIAESRRLFDARAFGLWGAWCAGRDGLAGFAGLWHFRDPPDLELVYGVADDCAGRGLATEIAQAIVDYGFGALGMPAIRASTDAGNTASIRVLEKLQFRRTRAAVAAGRDTVFFELPRPGAAAPAHGG